MRTTGTAYRSSTGYRGNHDVIVIGSGMGGLSVASLLAQEGKRVLLLEQHNVIGGMTQSYERDGYRWTVGVHYVGEVASPNTATWKLFDGVTGGGVQWAPLPDLYNRMVIGGNTYAIPAGEADYAAALKGWFPREAVAIDRYLDLLRAVARSSVPYFAQKALPTSMAVAAYDAMCDPFHAYSDRLTIDVLSELTSDRELIALLCANWGDYSLEPTRSSFAMHAMLAKHYRNGGSYPVGGGRSFADAIVPIIESAGGTVLYGAEVDEILVAVGRTRGVRLKSGEEIACSLVVSNAGVLNSFTRMMRPEVADAAGMRAMVLEVPDAYAAVGINVGLRGTAAELGFPGTNVWAHPGNDFEANLRAHRSDFHAPFPWTFTTFPSAKDPSWDASYPGRSTVEMYGYTDYRHFEQWAGTSWRKRGVDYLRRKADIEARLLDELYRHAPGARGAVDCVEVSTPLTYETFARRRRGGFMGIEASPKRFRQQWLRATTPIEGFFLTGQDVATDGVIGALCGGVIAASAILGRDLMKELRSHPPAHTNTAAAGRAS